MHVGVLLAHLGREATCETIRAAAASADALGYDSLWAVDRHLAPSHRAGHRPDGVEPLTALAIAADATERVRLGLHVVLGGAGGSSPNDLARALDDLVAAGRTVSTAVDVDLGPPPEETWRLVRPAGGVLVAGGASREVAALGPALDGWLATRVVPSLLARAWAAIVRAAADAGRDPAALELLVRADVELTTRPLSRHRSTFCGSLEQVVDDLVEVGRLGASGVVLGVVGEPSVDEVLGAYAAIAEGLELRTGS